MALRAVPDHPKFARLKFILKVGKAHALGLLEGVWHFCGRFTPQGDIGKYSDEDIEAWVEWEGEPGALIAALIAAKWLDLDDTHRLTVHDWHKHADRATRMSLSRSGLVFVTGTDSVLENEDIEPDVVTPCEHRVHNVVTCSSLPEPGAVPVPVSVPVGRGVGETSPPDGSDDPPKKPPERARTVAQKPPTVAEVEAEMLARGWEPYLAERKAEEFEAHYRSKSWKSGKTPITDWKACVVTWESRMKADGINFNGRVKPKIKIVNVDGELREVPA